MKIILLLLVTYYSYSQNAEILFKKKYSKITFEIGTNKLFTKNTGTPIIYEWDVNRTTSLGITYNYYQKDNLNMKISATYNRFNLKTSQISEYLNNGTFYKIQSASGPYTLLNFPIDAEYYIKLTNQTFFSLSSGLELSFNPYGSDYGETNIMGLYNNKNYKISAIEYSKKTPLFIGLNFGVSLNFSTKIALLKFNAKYHYQIEEYIYEGIAKTEIDGALTYSKHRISGNYFGVGLTIAPSKDLFR